jgi:hypothetical protein
LADTVHVTNCPRCGIRLLPGALACVNCDLPVTSESTAATGEPRTESPPPYRVPSYGAPPAPYGTPPQDYVPPAPYSPGRYPAPWTTNGLSVAGLILSILWIGGIGSLLGVIFGHVSRSQIKRRPQRGGGLSLAALIIGYAGLIGSAVFWANIDNIINSGTVQNALVQEDMKDAASAERSFFSDNGRFTNSSVDLANKGFDTIGDNTIYAAYHASDGYCLVGGHNGATTWYLYDSGHGGLSEEIYVSAAAAEAACEVIDVGDYAAIA